MFIPAVNYLTCDRTLTFKRDED